MTASSASIHGKAIDSAYDHYLYFKQHHSTVTHTYHEALHQIDKGSATTFHVVLSILTILELLRNFLQLSQTILLLLNDLNTQRKYLSKASTTVRALIA